MTRFDIMNYIKTNPHWLVGLIDGEGCFTIGISRVVSPVKGNIRYSVSNTFYLGLHGKDLYLLEGIQDYFQCGLITTASLKSVFFLFLPN